MWLWPQLDISEKLIVSEKTGRGASNLVVSLHWWESVSPNPSFYWDGCSLAEVPHPAGFPAPVACGQWSQDLYV